MNAILNRDIRKERDEQDSITRQEIFKNFTVDSLLSQFINALRDHYFDGVIPTAQSFTLTIVTPYATDQKTVNRIYLQDRDFKNEVDRYVSENIQELLDEVNEENPDNVELIESQLLLSGGLTERLHSFIIHCCDEKFLFGTGE